MARRLVCYPWLDATLDAVVAANVDMTAVSYALGIDWHTLGSG
ncbi:hypothetical protein [Kutzneria buriramensis]|uniref:Uncharacterized protein n=1 Tax=Kutzneria buriramensis TaxID=1045776 RepID=A0A3E0GWD3_9PSEU|nr:hypothetical protein [Kutzneria buriramensis]REH28617.1 hypothetical protein BCF44_12659 [Kutzneria buriramensis]